MAQAPYQDYTVAPTPAQIGSPTTGQPPLDPQTAQPVPWRVATLERAESIGQTSLLLLTSEQQVENIIPGTGLINGFDLFVNAPAAGNAATVVFAEDAPYDALSSVILKDVTGELINADGFSLKVATRYGGWEPSNHAASVDAGVYALTAGVGAGLGGSFSYHQKLPVIINRRTGLGLLGNQDRGQQYTVRHNYAASGNIYTTPPTTLPTMTVTRMYESYAVPNAVNDNGIPNQVLPGMYGIIPYITKSVSEAVPQGGATINHYIRRVGNVIRTLVLVFRSNGSRASAEANLPTTIQLKVGNETIFTEPWQYRRMLMYDRYGFDAPPGVLVYDFIHDFFNRAGYEFGNDWLWTQNISNFQFIISYPSGFGSTNNSLTFVTSDMVVPQNVNPYAM